MTNQIKRRSPKHHRLLDAYSGMGVIHFVPVGDAKLALHDFGGTGPALLILHCNGFPARAYIPLARRLAASFHCYGLDFRGHDESAHAPATPPLARPAAADAPPRSDAEHPAGEDATCNLDHFVEDIFVVVRWLRSRDSAVPIASVADYIGGSSDVGAVGHSLGGTLALAAELRRPGTFAAIFLYEPVIASGEDKRQGGIPAGRILEANALKRKAVFPSKAAVHERFHSRQPFSSFAAEALQLYIEHSFETSPDGSARLLCTPELEARIYIAILPHSLDVWLGGGAVRCPVIAAAGGLNEGIHRSIPEMMPSFADKLPLGRFERFEGLGHFGTFEDPDRVAERALQCLGAASVPRDAMMSPKHSPLQSRM